MNCHELSSTIDGDLKWSIFSFISFLDKSNMPHLTIKKIPSWLVDILPQDIVDILKQKFVEPKSKGRKSSIDIDNPNDFRYYMTLKGRKDPFETKIKGTNDTAVEYVFKNKKYKCIACLFSFFPYFRHPVTLDFIKEAPKWLQYLYIIYINDEFENTYLNEFTKAGPNYLYDIFMNCPNPLSLLEIIIKKSEEIYEAHKNPNFTKRTKIDKNADSTFYKSLSEPDKDKIINLMHQEKIFLDIDDDIIEEGNTSRILLLYGYYKLAEYCVKKDKINEFEKIVSQNKKDFKNFRVCKIIMPQFKEVYGHAYGFAHIDNDNEEIYNAIHEHASKLAYHGFYVELEFIFKHGFRFKDSKEISVFLKKLMKKL